MKKTGESILASVIAGRNVVGYHVTASEGEWIKRDPRYQGLSEEQKRLIDNLIDPS